MSTCNCAECRAQREAERSLPEKVIRKVVKVVAGRAVRSAVDAVTGCPLAGVVVAAIITGASAPEDIV